MKFRGAAVFFAVLFCLSSVYVYAQDAALTAANRRTATRYLSRAESALASGNWEAAAYNAEMGIAYDDGIADLWYVAAAAEDGRGAPRAAVLPLVEHALNGGGQWVDYNRDGARVLYADILCDTGNYAGAVAVLDSLPFIYSADAEFIRAKAFYRMNTQESVSSARDKINSARRIYQNDVRFPHLFFKYEYGILRARGGVANINVPDDVRRIADSFISKMPTYDNPDAELEIYAAIFAQDSQRKRLLEAFKAHGQKHPMYAAAAVRAGLMKQLDAIDYFFEFASDATQFSYLADFVDVITETAASAYLADTLNSYAGTLTFDTNGDLETNMIVDYSRGRPETIMWDSNGDGVLEWTVNCDFGVPVSAVVGNGAMMIRYGTYPAIVSANLVATEYSGSYQYADESFFWTPCNIGIPARFAKLENCDFFVPSPVLSDIMPLPELMIKEASHYTAQSTERNGASVMFALVDGMPVTAEYFAGDVLYAHAVFQDGLPVMRSVDNDGDGVFETTQFFGFDALNLMNQSEKERADLRKEMFDLPDFPVGVYMRLVQTDTDRDALTDFSEEYLADGGRISSWDTNSDGEWDMQYYRHPQTEGEPLVEESRFYKIPGHTLVTVKSVDGQLVSVESAGISYEVSAGSDEFFYWIGESSTAEVEQNIRGRVTEIGRQGVSFIYEEQIAYDETDDIFNENAQLGTRYTRFFVVRIGDVIFAEQVE